MTKSLNTSNTCAKIFALITQNIYPHSYYLHRAENRDGKPE